MVAGWLTHTDIHSDTWNYHREGLAEYHLLFTNPKEYFTNLFYTGYSYGYDGMLKVQNSYWNDLKTNLIIKLISVFHVFSGGNYYVNVIFYNFIIFFGHIGLYQVFKEVYQSKKMVTVAVVFLLPSVLFFGSTIHKDGLVLALIGVLLFNVWQVLQANALSFKRVLFILLSLLMIFLFRNFVLMALLPAIAVSSVAENGPLKRCNLPTLGIDSPTLIHGMGSIDSRRRKLTIRCRLDGPAGPRPELKRWASRTLLRIREPE